MAASTATLVAAALESVGYYAQEQVLTQLNTLIWELAALFYVVVGLMAIYSYVVYGSYDTAAWTLVAPGVVAFMLLARTESAGVEWRFGNYLDQSNSEVEMLDDAGLVPTSEVSWVFHRYNELVSSITSNVIAILVNGDEVKRQVQFMARPTLMDSMFRSNLDNPGLENLLKVGLQGTCGQAMEAMRDNAAMHRSSITAAYRKDTAEVLRATKVLFYETDVSVGNTGAESSSMRSFMQLQLQDYGGDLPQEVRNYCGYRDDAPQGQKTLLEDLEAFRDGSTDSATCEMIWCVSALSLRREVERIMKMGEREKVARIGSEAERDALIAEMWDHIAVKMRPADGISDANTDASIIPTVIGGILMRKVLNSPAAVDRNSQFAERSGYFTSPYRYKYNQAPGEAVRTDELQHQDITATAMQYEVMELALTLPYLQGIILYVLAATYPFFVLVALIPGRGTAIIEWAAWWAWVKIWDVGWAAVMIVDDVIWDLMPHHSAFDPTLDPSHGPVTWLQAAFHDDPAYSLTMYYMLLSTMLVGVPLVTGQMILGSKAALAQKLVQGFQGMAQKVGGYAGRTKQQLSVSESTSLRVGGEMASFKQGQSSYQNDVQSKSPGGGGGSTSGKMMSQSSGNEAQSQDNSHNNK